MTTERLQRLLDVIDQVERQLASPFDLRILVIGDPGADICRVLKDRSYHVECCPDRQSRRHAVSMHAHEQMVANEITDLLDPESDLIVASWDIVIADLGWDRCLDVHSLDEVARVIASLRSRMVMGIFAAVRHPIDPTNNLLGPWSATAPLRTFTYLSEWPQDPLDPTPPLLLASDLLLHAGSWFASSELTTLAETQAPGDPYVRAFMTRSGTIIKVEEVSVDYFERSQVVQEARFLGTVTPEVILDLRLPTLRSVHCGRVISHLTRSAAEGTPTSSPLAGQQEVIEALLDIAQAYARHGLFHNDIRPWNLLWADDGVTLIDFADTAPCEADTSDLPQVLALAGTMLACTGRRVPPATEFATGFRALAEEAGFTEIQTGGEFFGEPWLRLAERRPRITAPDTLTDAQLLAALIEPLLGTGTVEAAW